MGNLSEKSNQIRSQTLEAENSALRNEVRELKKDCKTYRQKFAKMEVGFFLFNLFFLNAFSKRNKVVSFCKKIHVVKRASAWQKITLFLIVNLKFQMALMATISSILFSQVFKMRQDSFESEVQLLKVRLRRL